MKTKYQTPIAQISIFNELDLICTSGDTLPANVGDNLDFASIFNTQL